MVHAEMHRRFCFRYKTDIGTGCSFRREFGLDSCSAEKLLFAGPPAVGVSNDKMRRLSVLLPYVPPIHDSILEVSFGMFEKVF